MRWPYLILISCVLISCARQQNATNRKNIIPPDSLVNNTATLDTLQNTHKYISVGREVRMAQYFSFIDSLTSHYPELSGSDCGEYALVLSNPWLVDSLRSTDYYTQKKKGKFQYDQQKQIILHKTDSLFIPTNAMVDSISKKLSANRIDVNIPEFKLRVIQNRDTVFTCKVRVGRNAEEYLGSVGRVVNQRTPIGKGKIIRALRNPVFYDLHTGVKLEETIRDDKKITRMPFIPSLEPEIDGVRHGSMFHATTNLKTVGKALSNGCIGLREADMWTLYYHAPVGTEVTLRYDLKIVNSKNDTILLKDIYHLRDTINYQDK